MQTGMGWGFGGTHVLSTGGFSFVAALLGGSMQVQREALLYSWVVDGEVVDHIELGW